MGSIHDEFQLSPRQHYIHRSLRADDRLLFAEHEFSLSFRTHHQWTAVRCRTPDHASDLGWKPDSCFERAFQCPNEHRLLSHHWSRCILFFSNAQLKLGSWDQSDTHDSDRWLRWPDYEKLLLLHRLFDNTPLYLEHKLVRILRNSAHDTCLEAVFHQSVGWKPQLRRRERQQPSIAKRHWDYSVLQGSDP